MSVIPTVQDSFPRSPARQVKLTRNPVASTAAKVLLVLLLPLAGAEAHALTYLILAGWALGGPRRAIEALTLTWLVSFLNPGIYTLSEQGQLLRWAVLFCAFASVYYQAFSQRVRIPHAWVWLAVYTAVCIGTSAYVSYAPDVSIFKLVSFFIGSSTILMAFHLTRHLADYWRTWFLTFFIMILILGFPLILHDLGYTRNARGFQGLTNQPQAYGVFIAPFLAWLLGMRLTGQLKGRWVWPVIAIAMVSLVATQARTAALAVGVGFALAFLLIWLRRPGSLRVLKRHLVWGMPVVFLAATYAVLNSDRITQGVEDFVFKGGVERYAGVDDAFYHARGRVIERSWQNFLEHPLLGIGFGVASEPYMQNVQRDPVMGLPVGASVEKGFSLVALLEETGLLGFTLFTVVLVSVFRPALGKRAGLAPAALILTALLVNFGEGILFALGGTGMMIWLLFGLARVIGQNANR